MDTADHGVRFTRANLHLRILGQDRTVSVDVPQGPARLGDLLPAAQQLCNEATAASVERVEAQGRKITCRKGCGACCRQLVPVSLVEALALSDLVDAMPAGRQALVRQRFADALARLEQAGLLDAKEPRGRRALLFRDGTEPLKVFGDIARRYFIQGISCPFLENESCSIHGQRPLVCREYHVTSPAEFCATADKQRVEAVKSPLRMADVLAETAGRVLGMVPGCVPLVLALEWADAHRAQLNSVHDGEGMFRAMMAEVDQQFERPFEQRGQ